MNAFLIVIPIILIRYGLLSVIGKDGLNRAGLFAPLLGKEKVAFWIYQITTFLILLFLLLLKIRTDTFWFYIGLIIYISGIILYSVSIVNYANPKINGINVNGLYKISRNPMYIAYFIYFLGCALLTHSWILFGLLIIFQISTHWIILSEERWCINKFGAEYIKYMNRVRRYF
ncbi:methyltransferase family protein [Candidatus Clostridium radicumherbarum]|uniref:Methyltransferase family protein n=1 Tax=Candidatus Clostridium radicumherbarum TaxID=3381662 RepID=A0ABW8TV67_9CLOT